MREGVSVYKEGKPNVDCARVYLHTTNNVHAGLAICQQNYYQTIVVVSGFESKT